MSAITLAQFKEKYSVVQNKNLAELFMRISAKEWLEYASELSGGKFRPDIDKIMKFSDAESNYEFLRYRSHSSINENVTIGELLRIADKMLVDSYLQCDRFREEDQRDAAYIVTNLLVYPFADYSAENSFPPREKSPYEAADCDYDYDEYDEEYDDEYDDEEEADKEPEPIPKVGDYPWVKSLTDLKSLIDEMSKKKGV